MPTVDQIRQTISRALERKGEGPITVALELQLERNYIRDFIKGDKNSLKTEVTIALSAYLDIPLKDLLITKERRLRRVG